MSVQFSNAYQEILLDNLVAIIKQNFVFQTQLKLVENSSKETEELQAKYNELIKTQDVLKQQLTDAEIIRAKIDVNASAHEEKSRLQTALNDIMKKNAGLEKELQEKNAGLEKKLQEKNAEIIILKEYILKLENIAPTSKLKKINPDIIIETKLIEQPEANLFAIKEHDGSSF